MRTIKKVIQAAVIDQRPPKQELNKFQRNYRSTPHTTTMKAPADIMFGRAVRTMLPVRVAAPLADQKIRQADSSAKEKMKAYADKKASPPSKLEVRDLVLIPLQKKDKLTPHFDPRPYRVTAVKGTMVTAKRGSHLVTRNTSQLKRCPRLRPTEEPASEDEDVDAEETMDHTLTSMRQPRDTEVVSTAPPQRDVETPSANQSATCLQRSRPKRTTRKPRWQEDYV